MFYIYNQNNSGGSFVVDERVGQYVIIEADNGNEANKIAEEVGIYFDGCDNGRDCSCCGDRWYPVWDEGTETPMIYDKTIEEFKQDPGLFALREEMCIHIYYKDGKHDKIVFNARKAIEKKKAKQRKVADKLWGNYFTMTHGIRNKNPIRFYAQKADWAGEKKPTYWDKSGNLSIKEGLDINAEYGWISFSSKNKKEVEEFMDGANELMKIAVLSVLETPKPEGKRGEGMMALAKLLARKV